MPGVRRPRGRARRLRLRRERHIGGRRVGVRRLLLSLDVEDERPADHDRRRERDRKARCDARRGDERRAEGRRRDPEARRRPEGARCPDTPEGAQAKDDLDTFTTDTQETIDGVKSALADIPSGAGLAEIVTSCPDRQRRSSRRSRRASSSWRRSRTSVVTEVGIRAGRLLQGAPRRLLARRQATSRSFLRCAAVLVVGSARATRITAPDRALRRPRRA